MPGMIRLRQRSFIRGRLEFRMRELTDFAVICLADLLGGGSLVVFGFFLFAGSLNLIDLGLEQSWALWLDGGLSILFFIQHSGMVRKSFRARLERFFPKEYHGAAYSIASGATLLIVLVLWQDGTPLLSAPPGIMRLSFRSLFFLSLAGFLWGVLSLKSFDPLGIGPLLARLHGVVPEEMPFSVRGPYRLVRHPLYLFSILMIWSCPDMTTDRLLFNLLWTGWIVIGAFLEERYLVAEFGDTYREYQRRVPMFIPGKTGLRR
ncbi:isoprenylcysteine carboxylmethyltransferase family protein [bacterium]|nr:isoprenylcysteine carboxylmethyltransferase family protein [bacterium]